MQSTTIMNFVYTILDNELYYCVALMFMCVQAFGVGLLLGTLILMV